MYPSAGALLSAGALQGTIEQKHPLRTAAAQACLQGYIFAAAVCLTYACNDT